jgi:predicted  nucleic acid-binding Zn-ribbon protein
MSDKQKLLKLLEELTDKQKEVTRCHDYYEALEKEIESKKKGLASPEDYADLERIIAALNREYEEKSDLLFEDLNETLLKGFDLSSKIGKEIAHDFKKLWDYMTQPMRAEVQLDRVLRDVEYIRKELM